MTAASKCRPRSEADPFDYPFTGDDGDADAVALLLDISKKILRNQPSHRNDQPMGEFMSREDILSITVLNHITAYLDNREEYAKMADELRGYLVIE